MTHLAQRRTGEADVEEPTGLLTHHLAMDDASFAFTAEFLKRTAAHPAVQWRCRPRHLYDWEGLIYARWLHIAIR